MLQPNEKTKTLLAKTRAKAKMYEYDVPQEHHFDIGTTPLTDLLDITIAMLGDLTASLEAGDLHEDKYKLFFSAQYFDSLVLSKAVSGELNYLNLLATTAYYLSGYPGSASVILRNISSQEQTEFGIFERVLLSFLRREELKTLTVEEHPFYNELNGLGVSWAKFINNGIEHERLEGLIKELRIKVYSDGSDREVLMVDIIRAVISKRIKTSAWVLLSSQSFLPLSLWRPYLERSTAIKELWPAQILLSENGVFNGVSAVIQMPTSAGKTRSSELIIRSSFLSGRSSLAVIVAPFRALCQEIFNDLTDQFKEDDDVMVDIISDVLQEDIESFEEDKHVIMILTPEKLEYLLRHDKEISNRVGLVIYDEGHLFDDETRGIKYELLLASLKKQLPINTQVVLISAVISNAQAIKDWLIGNNGVTVEAKNLNPTTRSIAFASWTTQRGRLIFTDEQNLEQTLFFVPRVLESKKIERRPRERGEKLFPKKRSNGYYDANHVAGFLGCKLASEGLSAIFTGRKDSALKIAEDLTDAFERGLDLSKPIEYSQSPEEAQKLIRYIERLLGINSIQAKVSKIGFLIHHGSTPHGLKLSVEHALQCLHFKSVICTSTLAQGVNLPIKYLVISTDRQGQDRIKVRDFHNLMGRAGRSGKYTEGTIIFANPIIYDNRMSYRDKWRWFGVKQLIDNKNSELCISRLLSLFEDEPMEEEEKLKWFRNQKNVKDEINSHLLNVLSEISEVRDMETIVTDLVKNTLGFFQATDEQKAKLIDVFLEISTEILLQEPVVERRKSFAKSVLSLSSSQALITFVTENISSLDDAIDPETVLSVLWDSLYENTNSRFLKKLDKGDALNVCKEWIRGKTYPELYTYVTSLVTSQRGVSIDQIVDLCEGGFGFSTSLIVGSISELLNLLGEEVAKNNIAKLHLLQRRLKYGLPEILPILIYEMGFSDRQLSIEIANKIKIMDDREFYLRSDIRNYIKSDEILQEMINTDYPEYFQRRMMNIIQDGKTP